VFYDFFVLRLNVWTPMIPHKTITMPTIHHIVEAAEPNGGTGAGDAGAGADAGEGVLLGTGTGATEDCGTEAGAAGAGVTTGGGAFTTNFPAFPFTSTV
jgi:hypothetical protein